MYKPTKPAYHQKCIKAIHPRHYVAQRFNGSVGVTATRCCTLKKMINISSIEGQSAESNFPLEVETLIWIRTALLFFVVLLS